MEFTLLTMTDALTPSRAVFDRAVDRGEVARGTDFELALDLLAGPLYWRLGARQAPLDADYLDRLTDLIVLHVCSPGRNAKASA